MRRAAVVSALFFAVVAWAGDIRIPPNDFWCEVLGIGCRQTRRLMPRIGNYYLPRGVGVIAQGTDMAVSPYPWWKFSNIMQNHEMLTDIANHDIRIANVWVRVNPFDGGDEWCFQPWAPHIGYHDGYMCMGGETTRENMDLFWTHPDFDVLVIRFEAWASLEEGCDGSQSLVWENEPTKGIVDTLYERYGDQNKVIILQNWEADWQMYGVGCKDRSECLYGCESEENVENCCDEMKIDRSYYLLSVFNERQRVISEARNNNPHANLRVYHAICINSYTDEWLTVARDVIPQMDEMPDFVGVSYWKKPPMHVTDALGYVESHTGLPRYRIYVSELGYPEQPNKPAYDRIMNESTLAFEWGVQMVLVWHWKYWGDDVRQQNLSLFETDNLTPKSGYWAVRELNDEWR